MGTAFGPSYSRMARKDYSKFLLRMESHCPRLMSLSVRYRESQYRERLRMFSAIVL